MQRIREFNEDVLYKSTSSITLHFPLGIPPAVQYTERRFPVTSELTLLVDDDFTKSCYINASCRQRVR